MKKVSGKLNNAEVTKPELTKANKIFQIYKNELESNVRGVKLRTHKLWSRLITTA